MTQSASCAACGHCCDPVVLSADVYTDCCQRARAGDAVHHNDRFIAQHWHPFGAFTEGTETFLELRCDLDMRGPRPQPFGAMPRGLLALTQEVLDTHELTAQAAVTGDRAILRRAMLTDPICNNIGDADACIRDLLDAERDALPAYWFKGVARCK